MILVYASHVLNPFNAMIDRERKRSRAHPKELLTISSHV